MKYAIKVPFGIDKQTKEPTDWIFVIDLIGSADEEPTVVVYETREEAETAALAWRVSKVVEYKEDEPETDDEQS
jgi:hypothetical protein